MSINTRGVKACLQTFDFRRLFIEELNWANCNNPPLNLEIDGHSYCLTPCAQQSGMVIYMGECPANNEIPSYSTRRKIESQVTKLTHEHIIIFTDKNRTKAIWQWVKREHGQSAAAREFPYYKGQTGESLLQKLAGIAFSIDDLDEEGKVVITRVTTKVAASFNVEKVTKRFYEGFKNEHDGFTGFIKGLKSQDDTDWYVSVMLNRLMFVYFIQKKNFLDEDQDYLEHKLVESKKKGKDLFYGSFLIPLFFEGFAREKDKRTPEIRTLLGDIPYLNGGIFQKHKLEDENPQIVIPDVAFKGIFNFFNQWDWHLDYRPIKVGNEINPDVLGYIFEKYINQKQMGAYYTKEDITDYICKNTIIPFLFDKLENMRYDELHPFPMIDVEPYIYDAVKQEEYLPTETEREYTARQKRYQQIKDDFAAGKITGINDLITYNLDIRKFTEDWARGIKDPVTLRAFYFHCLTKVTILDPAVGSGAFLFAALNILEQIYEICLDKMEELGGPKYPDFAEELKRISQHPNRTYYVLKSIIVNNLFGVDIMEEAVEICKLRLFLKLVAQVDDVSKIEPLPDIDFNIRAGNTLVGYATFEEINKAKATQLDLSGALKTIESRIQGVDRALTAFRELQTQVGIPASALAEAKSNAKKQLSVIQMELDEDLAAFYGARNLSQFIETHSPFHWFVEFYHIMKDDGFDVVIGNPPFLELRQVDYSLHGYKSNSSGAIHAMFIERGLRLLRPQGCMSMIMPMALVSTQRMDIVQALLEHERNAWYSNYAWRPGKLFDAVNRAITIFVVVPSVELRTFSTNYQKWISEDRNLLMLGIRYVEVPRNRSYCWIPKLSHEIERSLLQTCISIKTNLGSFMAKGANRVYYRTTGGLYWKVFTDFAPAFEVNGVPGHSTRETSFSLSDKQMIRPVVALLSSDIFWWWYTITTNCRDLNPYDINNFPVPKQALYDSQLSYLGSKYLENLKQNSMMLVREQKQTGHTETRLFKIQKSKPIIDEIDRVLAKHYGFTEEELDFIINYDIKYRMGKDNEEEEK